MLGQCSKQPDHSSPTNQPSPAVSEKCDFSSYKPFKGGMLQAPGVSLPQPQYPQEAKDRKLQGTVSVRVLVNLRSGLVERACVAEGDEVLGQAAVQAALKAKFAPDWGHSKYLAERYSYVETLIKYNFMGQ